jgi:hypothetical protein
MIRYSIVRFAIQISENMDLLQFMNLGTAIEIQIIFMTKQDKVRIFYLPGSFVEIQGLEHKKSDNFVFHCTHEYLTLCLILMDKYRLNKGIKCGGKYLDFRRRSDRRTGQYIERHFVMLILHLKLLRR